MNKRYLILSLVCVTTLFITPSSFSSEARTCYGYFSGALTPIITSLYPNQKSSETLEALWRGQKLGVTFVRFSTRARSLPDYAKYLSASANFKNFIKNKELLDILEQSDSLRAYSEALNKAVEEVANVVELYYSGWTIDTFLRAQTIIAQHLQSAPKAYDVLRLQQVISEYIDSLNTKNHWDTALPLELRNSESKYNFVKEFSPTLIYSRDNTYHKVRILDSGSDRDLVSYRDLLVRDQASQKEIVMKVGFSRSQLGGSLANQRQLLEKRAFRF